MNCRCLVDQFFEMTITAEVHRNIIQQFIAPLYKDEQDTVFQ